MEGLRGYNLSDAIWAGETEGFVLSKTTEGFPMSQRWQSMRVPPSGARRRSSAATAASAALRNAVRAQNRLVAGAAPARRSGVNSTSVFQPPAGKEKKFIDALNNGFIVAGQTTGSLMGPLNELAQGTDAINHVGREVTLKSLYWQFQCSLAATSAGASPIRIVIVYDKESNGAAPTIASGATSDIFANDFINTPNNLNNRDRFITLVDEVVESLGTGGPQAFYRKGYRKLSLPMVFNGITTATITAIQTGAVYAVVWQNGNIITASPTHTLQTRFRFEDA